MLRVARGQARLHRVSLPREEDCVGYSPIISRPPIRWRDGARIALWIVPNVEHYEYLPPVNPHRDPWARMPHPDVLSYANRDYGNRVGFWRMVEVFERHGVRPTVSLSSASSICSSSTESSRPSQWTSQPPSAAPSSSGG